MVSSKKKVNSTVTVDSEWILQEQRSLHKPFKLFYNSQCQWHSVKQIKSFFAMFGTHAVLEKKSFVETHFHQLVTGYAVQVKPFTTCTVSPSLIRNCSTKRTRSRVENFYSKYDLSDRLRWWRRRKDKDSNYWATEHFYRPSYNTVTDYSICSKYNFYISFVTHQTGLGLVLRSNH